MKKLNEYSDAYPNYYYAPKAVIAAVAFSLAMRLCEDNWELAQEMIEDEWDALYPRIVSQKPRHNR